MNPLRALALAGSLVGLAACATVGPNYKLPDEAKLNAPTAQGAFLGAQSAAVRQDPVPAGWWKLYDDAVLNALVEEALKANTDLRVAAANLARARAVAGEADDAGGFKVGASASAMHARESGEQFLLSEPLPVENLADAGVKVSYQVDLVGRLKRASEAAHADADASQAALDLARVSVAADVARAYVEACANGHELAVAQRTVDLRSRGLEVTRRLVGAGRGTAVDLTSAQALLDQSRAALPTFQSRRRAALYRLATLTGKPPAEFPKAVEACVTPPALKRPIPVGDGAALLKRRPDVRQAERTLAGATARIGVATAALYPSITLGAGAGSTGLLADIGQPAANRWGLTSLITWTLPGESERSRIRQAEAGADAALARFDGVVLTALRETETSLDAYAHDLRRQAALKAARDQAALAEDQARRLYQAGRSPYLAGLDAQRALAGAEAALAASDSQVAADQVNLFLALGGGWER
ncbi:efflux transporter outer membrane subunit [Caulobacter segnis]|uniref:efflux transporter outer membrane subunit n=1 Tax=Caulobacter segnis TaxID=88688 RepID=UPI002855E0BD|nr:efflux transporter outer membrane subunit [Caulobacter segnis]MDR6626115.1 NodT family efflux transporter outer membrane factor (OMF) lipoprotein [Caulobacter segnis]